jgi:hypothetical protein
MSSIYKILYVCSINVKINKKRVAVCHLICSKYDKKKIIILIRWDLQYSNDLWTIAAVHQEEERQN